VSEWLKSGAGVFPDKRRFPWGDAPPTDVTTEIDSPPEFPNWTGALRYMTIGGGVNSTATGPGTAPVMSAQLGVSYWGVLDLAGNVSELLGSCEEDLILAYGDGCRSILPTEFSAFCA
jgi:formylglycine-generating enzyme required for sulfatase activity